MALQRFLIAPYTVGLERDLESWLIPENAFTTLENAFVFRGRVKKRFGYRLLGDTTDANPQLNSRLRILVDTTDGSGNASGTVPGTVFKVGQLFSVGSNFFTVNATGTPASLLVNGTGSATYNTTTGAYTFTGTDINTDVYFYPSEPVMGLPTRENNLINQEETLAFDTQFCYQRSGGGWVRVGTGAVNTWTGDNTNFFWTTNYQGSQSSVTNLYVTNFNFNIAGSTADPIRYIVSTGSTFVNLRPQLNPGATRYLETCLVLLAFKDRLLAFNTIESTSGTYSQYNNRCRFSQNGDPTDTTNGWDDVTPGRGGFLDAPTKESIVSAEFIRDRLIVYFERSTWELVYTANQILPFRWQRINTELGAESTFSIVPFDKAVLAVGNRAITACSGADVQRIDMVIPDEVFSIHNGNNGAERVYGIRDFYSEAVYWTFPYFDGNPTYPNRLFVYNYQNNTWAIYKDTFTCFGYFQFNDDRQWQTLSYETWSDWNDPWNSSYEQSGFEAIIAGNQQGFTVLLDRDKSDNDEFYQVTDITSSNRATVVDHNLETGDYVQLKNYTTPDPIYTVRRIDSNTIDLEGASISSYEGGATLKRVSNFDIRTKRFSPFINQGLGFNLPYADFFVDKTSQGEFSVDLYLNESDYSLRNNPNAIPGSNILSTAPYPLVTSESQQDRLWHRMYFYTQGFNIQMRFYLSYNQMVDPDIAFSNFVLNGMVLYANQAEKVVG